MARPEFVPTEEQKRQVEIVAGAGVTHEEIAIGIGISRPTLRKHFAQELTAGAYQRRAKVLDALYTMAAEKGNAAAARVYLTHTPEAAAPPLEPIEPEKVPEGKKERAQAQAKVAQVGTDWAEILPAGPVQ